MGKGRILRTSVKLARPAVPAASARDEDPGYAAFCRERCTQWWLIWMACLAIIAIGWRVKQSQLAGGRQTIAEWQRVSEPLAAAAEDIKACHRRWEALQEREKLVSRLQPAHSPLKWLGRIGKAAEQQVVIEELQITLQQVPQLNLRGISRDEATASEFIKSLSSGEVSACLELQSIQPTQRLASEVREFTAQGQLQ